MEQSISSDLIRGHIDTIILHTLLSGDKFAQQISDCIEEKSANSYKINQATLYSSLKRLESLKYVNSYWNDSDNGRRKYFSLTESGKESVEANLSSWAYSRSIIDKLMDCTTQPAVQTQFIEKIVEVPVEKVVVVEKEVEKIVEIQPTAQNIEVKEPVAQPQVQETEQEINFRNVLNGLIKSNVVFTKDPEPIEVVEAVKNTEKSQEIPKEKPKFNDTIDSVDYNVYKGNSSGKIDFGDLAIKAAKEGYKLKISSKDPIINTGILYKNKLNFLSALIVTLIFCLELLFVTKKYFNFFQTYTVQSAIVLGICLLYPIFTAIKFVVAPRAKSAKKIPRDSVLTASIVVFNLLLITFAINLLTNVDFSNLQLIMLTLIIPCILYVNALIYYIVRFALSKGKKMNSKTKKTA